MIRTKIVSGLGNQLFQYALGRKISLKKNTTLSLDISFFNTQNLRSFHLSNYNISGKIENDSNCSELNNSILARFQNKILNKLPKYLRSVYYQDEFWNFEKEVFKIKNGTLICGYWQNYKYFEDLDETISEELTLKDVSDKQYNDELTKIQSFICSVSIHVRRGDYVSDPNARQLLGTLPSNYYKDAIAYIENVISSPTYFIFSDDLIWARKEFDGLARVYYVDIHEGQAPHLELDLMSKCTHNIIANSSFSWWGAFLNRNPEKIVIIPKRWLNNQELNSKIELKFKDWVSL